ncbi:MAG: PstS family phosphate ABC transporter substrate-binding protein [Planctomycetota bacterium]
MKALLGLCGLAVTAGLVVANPFDDDAKVDPRYPNYVPTEGVTGNIKSVGSDTMNNLMALWAENYKGHYPNVQVEIEGKGSSTAPPALIEGTSTFGPMSRPMKDKEIDSFRKKFGYDPIGLPTSVDMLAVFVNKDNPIEGLSLSQVDAIFSKTRKRGAAEDVTRWGQLGLTGEWANKEIALYGRNSASGTYGYFKEHALGKGDYKDTVREQPGSSAVVSGVANDKFAIGYSGIGYKTADVRVVPLKTDEDEQYYPGEARYGYSGEYPLARYLLLYVNYEPGSDLEPLRREFIRYLYSAEGQADVIEDGYLPLPANVARDAAAQVGIEIKLRKERQ